MGKAHRRLLSLALVAGLAAMVAGCGGGPGTPGGGSSGTPLTLNNLTASPAAGEALKSVILGDGGPSFGAVFYGGDITRLALGSYGAGIGDIVYSSGVAGKRNIKIAKLNGSSRTVVSLTNDCADPTWLRNGTEIAFSVAIGSDLDIYRAQADGQGLTDITNYGAPPNNAEQQPAGGYAEDEIAYAQNHDGDFEITVQGVDGGSPHTLTSNADQDVMPAWSPDRSRIVYASRAGGGGGYHLWIISSGGGTPYQLSSIMATSEQEPAWSPDGTRIAYSKSSGGNTDIYVCAVDGSGEKRLTSDPGVDGHPSWSPDGSRIVFESDREGTLDIYTMTANGGSETPLVAGASVDADPEWNPGTGDTRTYVGPANSDSGVDPPFGDTPLQLAIGCGGDAGPVILGMRCLGDPAAVVVKDLNETATPYLIGVAIHTPGTITLLAGDAGRGKALINYIKNAGGGALFNGAFDNVMILWTESTGLPTAIVPWAGAPDAMVPLDLKPGASAGPTIERVGGEVVIRGTLGAPGGGTCREVIIDATTGQVIARR
jgi:hypothetical protein